MTEDEKARLLPLFVCIEMYLQTMERRGADGRLKTEEEIKREVWRWLALAAWKPGDPPH